MDMWNVMQERYERYGRNAVQAGIPYADNPYKRGTAAYLAWSRGHNAHRWRWRVTAMNSHRYSSEATRQNLLTR